MLHVTKEKEESLKFSLMIDKTVQTSFPQRYDIRRCELRS